MVYCSKDGILELGWYTGVNMVYWSKDGILE